MANCNSLLKKYLIKFFPSQIPSNMFIPDDFIRQDNTIPPESYLILYVFPEDYQSQDFYQNPARFTKYGIYPNIINKVKSHSINIRYSNFFLYKAIEEIALYAINNDERITVLDYVKPDSISNLYAPIDTQTGDFSLAPNDQPDKELAYTVRQGIIDLPFNTNGLIDVFLTEGFGFVFTEKPEIFKKIVIANRDFYLPPENYSILKNNGNNNLLPSSTGYYLDINPYQIGFTVQLPYAKYDDFDFIYSIAKNSLNTETPINIFDYLTPYGNNTRTGYITEISSYPLSLSQELDINNIPIDNLDQGFSFTFIDSEWQII